MWVRVDDSGSSTRTSLRGGGSPQALFAGVDDEVPLEDEPFDEPEDPDVVEEPDDEDDDPESEEPADDDEPDDSDPDELDELSEDDDEVLDEAPDRLSFR